MPLYEPIDNDITDLTNVYFGSPGDWNPDNENNNDDNDLQFDAVSDDEEMIDTEFLDYCDGWNLFPKDLKNASNECIISASNMGKKALYFECMRRFLGWNPIETLKRNFLATTRYADSILYL